MLGLSAAYNLWPPSPRKWLLRRFDQSAIFLFIAATYTPFIVQMKGDVTTLGLPYRCLDRGSRRDLAENSRFGSL
jgi:hemolysin III